MRVGNGGAGATQAALMGLTLAVAMVEVHDDHADGLTDLDGGQTDAGRRVHGLQHVVHQRAQTVVDHRHGGGNRLQAWIGNDEDVANSHGLQVG